MENKGLLFIPDISGFTRFVNQTEIDHSRLIIQELLEILIDSNMMELQISEIEGDAILFYKYGSTPDIMNLYSQVRKMFCEFNRHIIAYDIRRYCQCKACTSAIDLKLKIITHYGEFTSYKVKEFNKLIGKDVIIAHQLLKNEIEDHEYWLLTKNVQDAPPSELSDWIKWKSSTKDSESGQINFFYTELKPLRNEITPVPVPHVSLNKKTKIYSASREYDTDIITLFHASGDFNYRHQWLEGVKKAEEVGHFLPRVGMKCRLILNNGESVIFSTSYSYSPLRIEFTETDENTKYITHYVLEKLEENKTRLTLSFYINKNLFSEILFNIKKKKEIEEIFDKSLINLDELVKQIHLPR